MNFTIFIQKPDPGTATPCTSITHLVVVMEGALNTQHSPEALSFLQNAMHDQGVPCHILLDAARLDYVNSSGLRVLAQIAREVRRSGRNLALCCASESLNDLVSVAGLSTVVLLYPTLEIGRADLI